MVSIVGSLVISFGIGGLLGLLGMGATTVGAITSIIMVIWGLRGILKTLLQRNEEFKKQKIEYEAAVRNGDKEQVKKLKFWNTKTIVLVLVQAGVIVLFQIPAVKEWVGGLLEDGFKWSKDQV